MGTASAAIIAEARARLKLGEPTAAIQDATILHDNESMNYRRLVDYMEHLRKLDELFASLHKGLDNVSGQLAGAWRKHQTAGRRVEAFEDRL